MERRLSPWFIVPLVCLVGAGFALTSLWNHTALMYGLNLGPSFCNISAHVNCDAVAQSRFSKLFGLPLDGYGLAFYLVLAIAASVAHKDKLIRYSEFFDALLALAFIASVFSVYLFIVSEFIVGALCILCVGMHVTNFTLLLLAWVSNRQRTFSLRLRQGVRELLSLPKAAFSGGASRTLLTASLLLLIAAVFYLPSVLAPIIAARSPQQQQIKEVLELALQDWKAQAPTDIAIQNDGPMRDYSKGETFAPLRIVEFSDYECPACRAFHGALEEILKNYGKRIHFVHKNYPLDQACNPTLPFPMHINACFLANAVRCAGEQGQFWEMNDRVFVLPEVDDAKGPEVVMKAVYQTAADLNLDTEAFKDCIYSGRQLEKIRQDIQEGTRLGVQGTPSVWMNGRKLKAANPLILKHLLENAGQ